MQVFAPVRLGFSVLRCWPFRHALVQDGLESIELRARQVRMLVHDDAADRLATPCGQAACLAVVEREAFLECDAADPGFDAWHDLAEVSST